MKNQLISFMGFLSCLLWMLLFLLLYNSLEVSAEEGTHIFKSVYTEEVFNTYNGDDYTKTVTQLLTGKNVKAVAFYYSEYYPNYDYMYVITYTDTPDEEFYYNAVVTTEYTGTNNESTTSSGTKDTCTKRTETFSGVDYTYYLLWSGLIGYDNYTAGDGVSYSLVGESEIDIPLFSSKENALKYIVSGSTAYSGRTAHPFQRNGAPFRLKLSIAQLVD